MTHNLCHLFCTPIHVFLVDVICDVLRGEVNITSQGGNGHKGQDGKTGSKGSDASDVSLNESITIANRVCAQRPCWRSKQ